VIEAAEADIAAGAAVAAGAATVAAVDADRQRATADTR